MISWGVARLGVWTCPGGPPRWQMLVSPCLPSPVTFKMWSSISKRSFCTRIQLAPALQRCRGLVLCCSSLVVLHFPWAWQGALGNRFWKPVLGGFWAGRCHQLGAQSKLNTLVPMGGEKRMKLGCRSWMGFYGSCGKIPLPRGWAAHMDDQLHRQQIGFPKGRIVFLPGPFLPGWEMFSSPQTGSVQPLTAQNVSSLEVLWSGGQTPRMGWHRGRWFHTHENTVCKQGMWKNPLHSRFYHIKERKCNSVSSTLLCAGQHGWGDI